MDKLIILEAHKQGIKLDLPRKFFKGSKGKVHSYWYEKPTKELQENTPEEKNIKKLISSKR